MLFLVFRSHTVERTLYFDNCVFHNATYMARVLVSVHQKGSAKKLPDLQSNRKAHQVELRLQLCE